MNERDYNIPLADVIPRRELKREGDVNVMSPVPDVRWDFLTLYNQGGICLARSKGHAKNVPIRLLYRGLTFISQPGYVDSEMSLEWNSFVDFVNNTD